MRVTWPMPARKKAKSRRRPETPFQHDRKGRALQEIGATIVAGGIGSSVVEEIAELVQRTCKYRWAGVYKIKRNEFVIESGCSRRRRANHLARSSVRESQQLLQALVAEKVSRIGQVEIVSSEEGFVLCHRDDAKRSDLGEHEIHDAFEIARFDDAGNYRPLKTV